MGELAIGAHVDNADPIAEAKARGTSVVQIFLGDPQSYKGPVVAYPGGAAGLLAAIREHLQVEARVTVLGHIQRGGSPTAKDRILASRLGAAAVEALVGGASGVMVGEVEGEVDLTPLKEAVERRKDINRALLRLSQVLAL